MSLNLDEVIEIPEQDLAEEIVAEIVKKTGKTQQEVFSMISEKQEKMNNLVSFEVVALVVAKEVGLDISKYITLAEKRIFNEAD
ncbi:MAG: DUF2240 family protein [Archaeoglobaceae archaeon]